ncbi:molybdopterin converting factor subunit 1 [Thiorhodococcus mannitoliphagus]|uniref:Molybdopterin synthase sulfur carrier subunit n=1 Tax=Thiorhodococcus mannitoliphagus TaxID=329406 RepID=A0A6P1E166_9GAMM|nr:molybdopterin converting factor subunit 1 [Thiorhodococcus mannitoliphagus]NEX21475.1 molybdopterin converting factor subunit 1 [Thiorhodococcus mannitoliphagus]
MIRILYFARLRDTLGIDAEEISLPAGLQTVGDLLATLRCRGDLWSTTLDETTTVMAAVNQSIVRLDTPISDGDEVAFFPPVTGG